MRLRPNSIWRFAAHVRHLCASGAKGALKPPSRRPAMRAIPVHSRISSSVDTINQLEQLSQWSEMAILITYDDSGGWYDHVMPPIVSRSNDPSQRCPSRFLSACAGPRFRVLTTTAADTARALLFLFLPSLPSPRETLSTTVLRTRARLRFIEDNWQTGRIGDRSFDLFCARPSPREKHACPRAGSSVF